MESTILMRRESSGDVLNFPVHGIIKYQLFSSEYLCLRFGLPDNGISKIVRVSGESEFPPGTAVPWTLLDSKKMWTLRGGCHYDLLAVGDGELGVVKTEVVALNKGKNVVEYVDISDDSDDEEDHLQGPQFISSSSGEGEEDAAGFGDGSFNEDRWGFHEDDGVLHAGDGVEGEPQHDPEILKMYRISALESVLSVKSHSEIFHFIKRGDFETRQVDFLPKSYNGNVIFELPPLVGDVQRGDRVRSMERAKDCYYWARTIPTSANVPKKDWWQFGKMKCTGSLECRNDKCEFFDREGSRNSTAWTGNYKLSSVHKVNEPVEAGGLLCAFCEERPFCVASCPATLFYMYAKNSLPKDVDRDHMSRLCIHQGEHVHPPRRVFSRESLGKIEALITKHHGDDPSVRPSRLRNIAIGDLIAQFHPDSASGLTEENEKELWDSLELISTPQKFTSLLRSVRKDGKDWKGNGIFDALRRMQENVVFPYIQRYRFPGQGSENDFPFIFKMSVKGSGSGVDILKRMQTHGNLFGSWVMFDVMKRITSGWLTFSAHVYDHHYRALCTIFTCELLAEDAACCEISWTQMIDVARQHGLPNVHIHGFMADNAIGGWNAVRKVFFGGTRDPTRERSDAFHWAQSLHRHTQEGIKEGSRAEHVRLWKKLRDAKNVIEAYKIGQEITAWWKAGHCYPEKLKFLQGWLAWWTVRWPQWGNYIRKTLSAQESALMLNSTGAESVHAAMRKSAAQKKIGLLEACEMDQNRAAGQIAAYTSYLNGGHRGNGPIIFELAFRAADVVGTPSKFIEATNLWVQSSPQFDLRRTGPLPGDVRSRSQKRKGPASAFITPHDSHCPDVILVTTPNPRGIRRRNLDLTDFEGMPCDHNRATVSENDNIRAEMDDPIQTPTSRLVTRSFCSPASAPSVLLRASIPESHTRPGTWHLRRTSEGRHKGPQCNGTCARRTDRIECRNYIKLVGYHEEGSHMGVVGITIEGFTSIRGVHVPSMLWFCPNNLCHRSRPRKACADLPDVPSVFQVQRGTNMSAAEIHFLSSKGLQFVGSAPIPHFYVGASHLRIDVNSYRETIHLDDPLHRLKSRNGKRIRARFHLTPDHLKRIQKAETEEMCVVLQKDVTEGNAFGKQFCVCSHVDDVTLTHSEYWVQICCFPTCSCDDFWRHHWYKMSFMLCKHLYWVFLTLFRMDIRKSLVIVQHVLTVGELKGILDWFTDMD